jgi:citronellol/citronellal dehydrogenase
MNAVKNAKGYVLKSIKKDTTLASINSSLSGKSYIVAGGTRGIGFNIAKKLAKAGANVTICGKTEKPHPKLEGTIYSAAEEISAAANRAACMGIVCDIRNPKDIDNAIFQTTAVYGGIDGVVLNASALCLNNTLEQSEKEVSLMSSVNINGSYLFGKKCLEKMKNNDAGQMLVISPPLNMLYNDDWWLDHFYYSMSKYNMSLMAHFWNKEFSNVGINTLWPRTTIDTAPVRNILGGSEMVNVSRKPDIMGDAATIIFKADPSVCNGKSFIDDEVLVSANIDVEKYRVNPNVLEKQLMPDFFC